MDFVCLIGKRLGGRILAQQSIMHVVVHCLLIGGLALQRCF